MPKMKRAVAYTRYSSSNQREESIEAQVRAIEKFCTDNGYLLMQVYKDSALSGTSAERPAFQEMIKDAKTRSFDYVIVHKLDRFARNRYDSATYKNVLKKHGVKLISVLENLGDSPESIILESVIEGMNEYYSRNLSREVKKGMAENAYKGKFNGGTPPLGYDVTADGEYILNHWEAGAVKLIFEMYAQGFSYTQIMKEANARGYRTKQGNPFGRNSFYEILRNEKYLGTYIYGKEDYDGFSGSRNTHRVKDRDDMIVLEGRIPRIVDDATWALVQKRRAENKKRSGSMSAHRVYILSGLLTCAFCHEKMHGTTRTSGTGRKYHYYQCNKNTKTHYCKSINVNRVEPAVLKAFDDAVFSDANKGVLITAMERYSRIFNETDLNEGGIDYQAELLDANREIKNIVDAITAGGSSSTLLDRLKQLEAKKETILKEMDRLIVKQKENTVLKDRLSQFLHAHDSIKNFTPEQQKTILSLFIEKIVYDGHVITVHLRMINPEVLYQEDNSVRAGVGLDGAGEGI